MPQPRVRFMFDFGSPNAYLSHKVIPDIESRTGVRFEYVPTLLGGVFKQTNNRSPAEAFAGIPVKLAYERLERERFVRRHGLDRFQPNPHFPVNTLTVMRAAVAAQRLGVFEPYVDAVYAGMWERGLEMSQPEIIAGVLRETGLDADALLAATQDAEVKAALLASTQAAVQEGMFGSPTFFVDDEIYFGKDKLRDVEEEIMRRLANG